jgi:PHD/YefM family antitoxin component YafN of YafNO toxin-antitoxin module
MKMLTAHQQITDETGQRFVILTLEEYNALRGIYTEETEEISAEESKAIQQGLSEITNGEVISAQEVAAQLGLRFNSLASKS